SDRQHRTCDKHDPGYGHRSFLPVRVHGNAAAEYLSDHHHMQHRAFLFYAVSDDEKLALQDERILGDDGNAHGGQLDQDYHPGGHAERGVHAAGGVQLLFCKCNGTVSAVIFIAGARTMVITTKIKELQYFNEFNEIFVLSLLILFTNLIARALFQKLAERSKRKENIVDMKKVRKMSLKRVATFTLAAAVAVTGLGLTGCGAGS